MKSLGVLARGKKAEEAAERLTDAFRRVFITGGSSQDDRDLVVSDLGAFTGFYEYTSPEVSDGAVRFSEGQRSVFARIAKFTKVDHELAQVAAAREKTLRPRVPVTQSRYDAIQQGFEEET